MNALKLLADMNISPSTVQSLRGAGWDVAHVTDLASGSAPDEEILSLARSEGRVIVTQDLDFSALVALGGHAEPSLITVRLPSADPEAVSQRLLDELPYLNDLLASGAAVTIDENTVRARKLPIE